MPYASFWPIPLKKSANDCGVRVGNCRTRCSAAAVTPVSALASGNSARRAVLGSRASVLAISGFPEITRTRQIVRRCLWPQADDIRNTCWILGEEDKRKLTPPVGCITALEQQSCLHCFHDLLLEGCGIEAAYYSRFRTGAPPLVRDLLATTPAATCCMTFSHPAMQEVLLAHAEALGTEGAPMYRMRDDVGCSLCFSVRQQDYFRVRRYFP